MRNARHLLLATVCAAALLAACSQKSAPISMQGGQRHTNRQVMPAQEGIPFRPVFNDVKEGPKAPSGSIMMKDLDAPVTGTVKPNPIRKSEEPHYKPRSEKTTPVMAQNIIPVAATTQSGTIQVKPGDTLYSLAQRHGIPARDIVEANDLKPPYDVQSRRTLRLPSPIEAFAPRTQHADIQQDSGVFVPSAPQPRSKPELNQVAGDDGLKTFHVKPRLDRKGKFIWPVEGEVISRFGPQSGGLYNDGVNIAAPEGASIHASMDGTVVYVGDELKSYGNLLILRHENGWLTAYAHTRDILVEKGDHVKLGQVVAHVGRSGNVKTSQVHFGIREGKKPLDPLQKVSG